MTAREMFKELDFIIDDETSIRIEYENDYDSNEYIFFDKKDKDYIVSEEIRYISVDLHKAITQQMKELGWLDE